jgi:hypothetical protein
MKILVACEYSGTVRDAFRALGHDAISCDILPSERPGPHLQCDVLEVIGVGQWDMMIAFPPCRYLAYVGEPHMHKPGRAEKRAEAIAFARKLWKADIPMIAMENPRGILSKAIRPPDQEINPFEFGHNECKRTNLWLKNLPPLMATALVYPHKCFVEATNGKNRAQERARTFPGIARAMADQWGRCSP